MIVFYNEMRIFLFSRREKTQLKKILEVSSNLIERLFI